MKPVNINLTLISIPSNTLPEHIIPCPRANVFQHPIMPNHITQTGNYNYTFNLENNGRCGIDFFAWENQTISVVTDLPIITSIAGQYRDQIQTKVHITEAGSYNITGSITEDI